MARYAANGVQHVNPVLHQLVGGHLLGVFAFLDQTALDAILDIGELDAAVADGAAAMLGQIQRVFADFRGDLNALALQQPLISVDVTDDFDFRSNPGVFVNQESDCGTKTRGQTAGSKNANFFHAHAKTLLLS